MLILVAVLLCIHGLSPFALGFVHPEAKKSTEDKKQEASCALHCSCGVSELFPMPSDFTPAPLYSPLIVLQGSAAILTPPRSLP